MYAQANTFIPSAQQMGLGQFSFDDLRRAARRSRGMGQVSAPPGGIAPGSSCYDPSHDGGEIHCASAANVLLSALPFNSPTGGMTTTCSAAELACLQTAPADVLNAAAQTPDVCTSAVGISCPVVMIGVVLLLIAVPLLTAGSRL
jgi:hypothetical protein